uniref:Late embryogenesis abundant protein LEA-2 subgroup domain-containing protein n=1 Tax=Davidia involucrata TaxID=16924 RepID=A0A5B7ATR2_DAVIN
MVIVILIVFFTVFKPKDPKISIANGTVNFTFSQYVSVKNPNRAVFTHYDSTLQLLYSGSQVGFMFIPAGKIDAGRAQYMAATFSVQSFPLSSAAEPENVGPTITDGLSGVRVGPTMEIELRMKMAGRVRLLHFFAHHVEAKADCRVAIAVSDGSVLGFHC